MRAERLPENPIIRPDMDSRMGNNVNGPSLIRAPEWLDDPLDRFYLYFAHHNGTYIRLATAPEPAGPYTTYEPGVLDLTEAFASHHIASPDVHIDDDRHELVMYYHGRQTVEGPVQETRVAISKDGLSFVARPDVLGAPYFRVFEFGGWHYAIGMPGIVYRSCDGRGNFERGPQILSDNARHVAVLIRGRILHLFYSIVGSAPEKLLVGEIDLGADWMSWSVDSERELLGPELGWEGANEPLERSRRGAIDYPVNQLRDPCIFEDADQTYLLYSVAGEQGIAIAKLIE